TDRFTYWPARADRGGEILAPGSPDDPTQFIDVRDLADFLLLALEQRRVGIYNADAPAGALTMGQLLATCQAVARRMNTIQCVRAPCPQPPGHDSTVTWVPADVLAELGVSPWQDMPAWIPAADDYAGFGRISSAKAHAAGLRTRPLEDTVADTLAFWRSLPDDRRSKPKAGLSPEREAEVLAAWHAPAARDGGWSAAAGPGRDPHVGAGPEGGFARPGGHDDGHRQRIAVAGGRRGRRRARRGAHGTVGLAQVLHLHAARDPAHRGRE